MEDKLRGQLGEAERRAAAAEGERKDLQQQKYALDARVSELSAKLGAAEGERRALKEEVERLGKEAGETARGRHEAERALGELRIDAAGLRQQVAAKEELAGALKKRLADAEAAQASLGETLGEVRRANQSLEARLAAAAGEVDKGNQIIDRLQAELKVRAAARSHRRQWRAGGALGAHDDRTETRERRSRALKARKRSISDAPSRPHVPQAARAKMKLKAAVIAQQEAVLTERQGELERVTREALHLRQALEREEHARGVAEARAEDQRRKLEEAQSLLESNQQMIQWLNAQVTEAQLGRYAPSSSRYSFRSSVTLPGGRGGAAGAGGAVAPGSIAQKYVEAANMPRGVTAGDRGPGEGPLGRPQSGGTSSAPIEAQ